jgi:uncharacterized membrane protein YraQ (UPF0718 family)
MFFFVALPQNTFFQVLPTFLNNWPFLVFSAVITALLKLYIDQKKVAEFLPRNQNRGIVAATLAAVGTPLFTTLRQPFLESKRSRRYV